LGEKNYFKKNYITMFKILIFSVFFSLITLFAQAEIVKKIVIEGNKRISNETVKIYGEIELNKNYSEKDLDPVLRNLYGTGFFENVTIKLTNNTLSINLKEYPFINQLIILGEKKKGFREQIIKILNSKEKRPFVKSNLSKDIEIIKNLYSSLGYTNSSVVTKIKKINNESLDLLIEVSRGEKTKIISIDFLGNQSVRANRLRDVIASEENKFWKIISRNTNFSENLINLDIRLLSNFYKSIGYYDVKITSNLAKINKDGKAELVYSIDEGKRYTINKISTNVDSVFDKKIFFPLNDNYQKFIGEYYSPFKVKKLLENLDDLIESNNLQFVEHNVEEIIEGDSIKIIFNVFEGEKNLVERIQILGNNVTNEDVIRGELILDEGDPFSNLNLEKSISNLKARNIFSTVNYNVEDGSQSNLKLINITVEEKPTGEISAGAGIGTNGGSFAFNVKENNWLGEGKSVGFDIEVDKETLAGTISYVDPNYDFLGNSIRYSLSNKTNDYPNRGYENTISSASVNTSFEQYKDINVSLGLGASYDDLKAQSTASDSLKTQAGSFTELAGSYGFTMDKRNRAFQPTDGSIISFGQTLPIYADKSFVSNTLKASKYLTLNENVVGASKFILSTINGVGSDDVRLSKRTGLSTQRLRGFEKNKVGPVDGDDHIGGNYAAALNFEANLPNLFPEDTNLGALAFLDFGNVWGVDYDDTIDKSNKIRSSFGASVNWLSPIGPLMFTLSQNLTKAATDTTETFNFNLGTTF